MDDAIEFIVAKTELLAEHALSAEERAFMQKCLKAYDDMWQHPRLSMQQLRSIDGEMLERHLNYSTSPVAEAEIRKKLFSRFKTTRLRKSDEVVAKRVLKRGHIEDIEEYYQVKEFVACVDNSDVLGEENYGILASLLEGYDGPGEETPEPEALPAAGSAKPSRRRPPPPFDLIFVDDEKLCATDTPLDTRVTFVRAKIALVLKHLVDAEQRETLRSSLFMTLDNQLRQAQTAEAGALAAAWSEHEADYFAGYKISGATHREIESELEKQFGFRRLGPSAQERLRRMLKTNDALDSANRLFIERFIYAYPHQTLFTRAEIKRAEELLKLPSPSQPPQALTMTPRPKSPPDMTLLSVGAVFEVKSDKRLHKVIAFDELEMIYDVDWGQAVQDDGDSWTFGMSRSRCFYYSHATPLFLDGAKKLRVDEPTQEFLALHRPDLPLRFARSAHAQWREKPLATLDEFIAYLEQTDPALLKLPPVNAGQLVLIPRSPKGAHQRSSLVKAKNGSSFAMVELLWHAHQLQRPFTKPGMRGIGVYRCGLEKKGVPSYRLGCYLEPGSTLEWYEKAPIAP